MSPYENVQIGKFLMSLGYSLCELGETLYGSINLYQQTPNDSKTGDVFGVLNGRYLSWNLNAMQAILVVRKTNMPVINLSKG